MNELYFLVMNIPEETKDAVYHTSNKFDVCEGMSESEMRAYYLGIENTISALKNILEQDKNSIVINNSDIETSEEMDIDELTMLFCED